MDQVAIIPSGVNQLTTNCFVASEHYICYASTLAVYVHANKPPGYPLLRVLTGPTKPIIAIAYDGEVLCAPCDDRQVFVWELITGEKLGTTNVDMAPLCVAASPRCLHRIFMGGRDNKISLWLYREGQILGQTLPAGGDITCCAFSQNMPHIVGLGTSTGNFLMYDMLTLRNLKKFDAFESLRTGGFFDKVFGDSPCINDIAFDPLSDNYVILASITGYIILVDTEKMTIMHTFDRCNTGVSKICWVPNQPGTFLSCDGTTNTIRSWNVSSRVHLTSYRPKNLPIIGCAMVPPANDSCIVGFDEGSIGVYNMALKRLEMSTLPGHSETVFDVRYACHDPDIVSSGSFDKTVKVWNTKNMSLISSINVGGVAYCVDWSPDGSGLAVALHTGEVAVYNPTTGKEKWKKKIHAGLAWRVTWNKKLEQLLASTSRDGNLTVMRVSDGEKFGSFNHGCPVFGVSFSTFDPKLIATGAFDNKVRLITLNNEGGLSVVRELTGHTAECYNVEFHPLLEGVIASSSNDKTVRVWNTKDGGSAAPTTLVGHTDKVRGLCWCPCAPYLLLSGSWDGTIRAWDVRTGGAIGMTHNHTADVYTISTHPKRPLVYVSGSRDTTLRFWKLKLLDHLYMDCAIGSMQKLPTPDECMSGNDRRGCGPELQELLDSVNKLETNDTVGRLALVASYFDFPHGVADVINCVRYMKDSNSKVDDECIVAPMDVIARVAEKKAQDLEAVKKRISSAVGGSQVNAKLIAAAETYLRLGRVKEYCELLISAGEWERGIAAAPMVSLEYWRELCKRSADRLADAGDVKAVEYFVCANEGHKAAEFLANRKEYTEAMLVVQHCPQRVTEAEDEAAPSRAQHPPQVDSRTSMAKLTEFSRMRAEAHVAVGNPNLAAAAFASAHISDQLINSLIRGGSTALAHLVIHAMPLNAELIDLVFLNSMVACAGMKEWSCAATCCTRMRSRVSAAATLVALFRCAGHSEEDTKAYAKQLQITPDLESGDGSAAHQVAWLVASCRFGEAVNNGLSFLEDTVVELQGSPKNMVSSLEQCRLIAAQIVFSNDLSSAEGALNKRILKAAYIVGVALAERYGFSRLCPSMLTAAVFCTDDHVEKTSLEDRVKNYQIKPYSDIAAQFSPLGTNLPNNDKQGHRAMSFISDTEVSGPPVELEDGKSVISAQEAQLWHQCCWFSPLATGERLFPYF